MLECTHLRNYEVITERHRRIADVWYMAGRHPPPREQADTPTLRFRETSQVRGDTLGNSMSTSVEIHCGNHGDNPGYNRHTGGGKETSLVM